MKIAYRNDTLEQVMTGIKAVTSLVIVASFALLFGFYEPPLPAPLLVGLLIGTLTVFIAGKIIRLLNAESPKEYLLANWYEIPMLTILAIVVFGAGRWFGRADPDHLRHWAMGLYLIVDVTIKFFMGAVHLAATGREPARVLIAIFLVLIVTGAGLLMLPKATPEREGLSFVDALFTATSATCVTGLIVRDTGRDFTLMGQLVILTLIQLGGLGIVILGAVLTLLLGQVLTVRESAAMQDLLSEGTLGRINRMVIFIILATGLFELIGAVSLLPMWNSVPGRTLDAQQQWYYSLFHAISAFCNAGFSLFESSLMGYSRRWGVYLVICPLIILGGLGFSVLYDLGAFLFDRISRVYRRPFPVQRLRLGQAPKRLWLQTKIVLSVSVGLLIGGMLTLFAVERLVGPASGLPKFGLLDAFFQSVSARTVGFNTVDIAALSDAGKFVLVLLMFIGGSPGSTAGGIKTVTLAVILATVIGTLRRREEVEMFSRSIRLAVVRRAITITALFGTILFLATLSLCITEASNHFAVMQIFFEAASALGTVGLTTGITPALTGAGKLIIIVVMLAGRLGPLTLLAALTFNLKPARYSYPSEVVLVG